MRIYRPADVLGLAGQVRTGLAGLELAKQRGDDAPPMPTTTTTTQTTGARGATSKDA